MNQSRRIIVDDSNFLRMHNLIDFSLFMGIESKLHDDGTEQFPVAKSPAFAQNSRSVVKESELTVHEQ